MEILLPILIICGIALVGGLILVFGSVYMTVADDETAEKIQEVLPGANCGGCGFSGCAAYAKAIADKVAPPHLCGPGGSAVAEKIGKITGLNVLEVSPRTAVVACRGCHDNVADKMDYRGIASCAAASTFYGGTSACTHGCMGIGDCVRACVYGAISIENGVAKVDQSKCTGCSTCSKACPKGLIKMVRIDCKTFVLCSSRDKGALTAKTCKAGCIGCGLCVKNCPEQAITLDGNLAVIDSKLCSGCGKCAAVCPRKAIGIRN